MYNIIEAAPQSLFYSHIIYFVFAFSYSTKASIRLTIAPFLFCYPIFRSCCCCCCVNIVQLLFYIFVLFFLFFIFLLLLLLLLLLPLLHHHHHRCCFCYVYINIATIFFPLLDPFHRDFFFSIHSFFLVYLLCCLLYIAHIK